MGALCPNWNVGILGKWKNGKMGFEKEAEGVVTKIIL